MPSLQDLLYSIEKHLIERPPLTPQEDQLAQIRLATTILEAASEEAVGMNWATIVQMANGLMEKVVNTIPRNMATGIDAPSPLAKATQNKPAKKRKRGEAQEDKDELSQMPSPISPSGPMDPRTTAKRKQSVGINTPQKNVFNCPHPVPICPAHMVNGTGQWPTRSRRRLIPRKGIAATQNRVLGGVPLEHQQNPIVVKGQENNTNQHSDMIGIFANPYFRKIFADQGWPLDNQVVGNQAFGHGASPIDPRLISPEASHMDRLSNPTLVGNHISPIVHVHGSMTGPNEGSTGDTTDSGQDEGQHWMPWLIMYISPCKTAQTADHKQASNLWNLPLTSPISTTS